MPNMHDVPSLLVPFAARRVAQPSIMLRDRNVEAMGDEDWLDRYAYGLPRDDRDDCHFLAESKVFFAERYGGQGLLTNGGGARCGNDGPFQVKGIGPTPLVGRHTDFWYQHGGASLIEAVREVIWSRILRSLLPYGACQISGLIDSGTQTWRNCAGEKVLTPRALIVRETVWRPAHFERSLYFVPTDMHAASLPHDTERCRASTGRLMDVLPIPIGADRARLKAEGVMLLAGMAELADRFAIQLSAAREHRIMHGGLSSSNVAIDGRFIDFGSASHLPGFANTRNFVPAFWDDHHALLSTLTHVCLYLQKYQKNGEQRIPDPDWLIHRFQLAFETLQARAFVALVGLPASIQQALERENSELVQALGDALIRVAKRGSNRPYYGDPTTLAQHGRYRLNEVITELLRTYRAENAEAVLRCLIPDDTDRSPLMQSFNLFFDAASLVARRHSISATGLSRGAAVTTWRRLRQIPELFGPALDREIEDVVLGTSGRERVEACEALVNRRVAQGLTLKRAGDDFIAWVEDPLAGVVRFDAYRGEWLDGRSSTEPALCRWESDDISRCKEKTA